MKKGRRLLAILMAICLVCAYMPVSVFGVEGEESGTTPEGGNSTQTDIKLKFSAAELEHGSVSYKIGGADYVDVDETTKDASGAIWINLSSDSKGKTIYIKVTPENNYAVDGIVAKEGEGENAPSAYGATADENGVYSFPLDSKVYPVEIRIIDTSGGGNPGGGEPGGNQPTASSGELTFNCLSHAVKGGKIYYKPNNTGDFIQVTEDNANNRYNSISLKDTGSSITSIAIKLVPNEGYNLDTVRGVRLNVNGNNKFNVTGNNTETFLSESGCTFELSELVGENGSVSESSFEIEFGFGVENGNNEGNTGGGESGNNPDEGNQTPENHGDADYISFDVRGTNGSISYQCASSKESLSEEGWQSVSTENGWYVPIAKNLFESTSKVFFRIKGNNSKHLDVDGAFRILDENHQCKYTVLGTYNDDPEYDSNNNGTQPSGKIGLKDMYDNTNDYYIIPVDRSLLIDDSIRYVEFRWIDVMPISVEIDEASQYMIANGKTEIGIASGKGFGISVQNGSNVSIPLLEDTDLEGKEERYLIDLKVNRNYFIPELSINGNVYQTFDTGGGGDGYTNIAVAVPAKEFKSMVAESNGKIVVHLTVDKNVSVENQDVQASFNMINNGTIPEGVNMENLDADVVLSATDSTLTEDEIAEGAARAFDITMSVESKPETEFLVPIDISIDGNFSGDENNYSVIREHEGETPQVLECHVEKGEDNDILTFSTSKFSKFTIVYKENSSNSSGGITVIPSLPSDNDITNSGSGADASTSVDVSDKTTVTDSKAETKVDADLGNKIVENALKNNSTDVVINAGTSAGDSTGTTVTLPESTVKALAKDTEASVTIKTDSAEVSLDKDAVAAVAAQAGSEGEVKLVVETKEQNKNKVEIELTLVTSNGTVSSFNGGTVTVTVPVSQELADKKVVCVYIDENGKYHKVDGAINEAGTHYTFTTGHFSTYAVMSEEDAEAVIKQQTADEQKAKIKKVKATVTLSTKDLKKGIRVTVKVPENQKADKTGIIIYRSTKKDAKTYAVYKKVATKGSTYIIRNTKNVKEQKLTSGKKYYYKVRAYKVIDGKTYYGPMSSVKSIKAK